MILSNFKNVLRYHNFTSLFKTFQSLIVTLTLYKHRFLIFHSYIILNEHAFGMQYLHFILRHLNIYDFNFNSLKCENKCRMKYQGSYNMFP